MWSLFPTISSSNSQDSGMIYIILNLDLLGLLNDAQIIKTETKKSVFLFVLFLIFASSTTRWKRMHCREKRYEQRYVFTFTFIIENNQIRYI